MLLAGISPLVAPSSEKPRPEREVWKRLLLQRTQEIEDRLLIVIEERVEVLDHLIGFR